MLNHLDKFHLIRHWMTQSMKYEGKSSSVEGGGKTRPVRASDGFSCARWFNLSSEQKGLLKETLALNKRLNKHITSKEIFGSLWNYTKRAWALKFLDRWEADSNATVETFEILWRWSKTPWWDLKLLWCSNPSWKVSRQSTVYQHVVRRQEALIIIGMVLWR